MNPTFKHHRLAFGVAAAFGVAGAAQAQIVVNDTLTGNKSTYAWDVPVPTSGDNGACLTAGDSTSGKGSAGGPNTIPACVGLAAYKGTTLVGGATGTLPDTGGNGALRLTNGDTKLNGGNGNNQKGAVVSNRGFSTKAGVQISWTSVTYGGNGYDAGQGQNGADGITFFLADANQAASIGGNGGSLGYSCSNGNGVYEGVRGGYVAVGADEYGNFVNSGDNTSTGIGFKPGRIGVRGAGNTNWYELSNDPIYKNFVKGADQQTAVKAACKSGFVKNYSSSTQLDYDPVAKKWVSVNSGATSPVPLNNYKYLTSVALPIDPSTVTTATPSGTAYKIANQEAQTTSLRKNAAFISYQLSITPAGILDLYFSVNGGTRFHPLNGVDIVSLNNSLPLPDSVRFGFSAGTGGGSNVHEITCFKAAPTQQSNSSAGSNVQQGERVTGGTQIYLGYYYPDNWYSSLTAVALDPATAAAQGTRWDANCLLTGGACAATGATVKAIDPTTRTILSWNGSTGVPFEYSGGLSNSQISALNDGDSSYKAERINWIRGDRSNEIGTGSGALRTRVGVLGDIVDSSPVWVGPPQSPYTDKFVDLLNASASMPEGTSYAAFAGASGKGNRLNVVYVGANDGMLHGFSAGSYSGTTFVDTANTGAEVLAYVPGEIAGMIHQDGNAGVDLSSPGYSHNFFVDGTPGTGDLYYGGAWHTWVVGGLGAGGQPGGPITTTTTTTKTTGSTTTSTTTANTTTNSAIFALDTTNPADFSEANAGSLVIGEWTPATIAPKAVCPAQNCATHLGQTYGTPQVRRLHDGNWGVIFGNGLNSPGYTAGIFVMIVDQSNGAKTFRYLDTGNGSSSAPNGIAYVTPADLDGDHITDYVYAGDQQGNIWRFDLTDKNDGNWKNATSIFSTGSGTPITTRVSVASVPVATSPFKPKLMVAFGTGQKQPLTLSSAETYASATQYLYGIWDWNLSDWNGKSAASKFDVPTTAPTTAAATLQAQTIKTVTPPTGNAYRTIDTTSPVCWWGSTVCGTTGTAIGWRDALPGTLEQVIYNPTVAFGEFIVNTTIPTASATAQTCDSTPPSGFTMAVLMSNGGASTTPFLPGPNNDFSTPNVVGISVGGVGSTTIVTSSTEKAYIVQQTIKGTPNTTLINPTGGTGARVNWTKVR
jgi:type IV pilus assembly protein PilY1